MRRIILETGEIVPCRIFETVAKYLKLFDYEVEQAFIACMILLIAEGRHDSVFEFVSVLKGRYKCVVY
jgi:hypothetical protein